MATKIKLQRFGKMREPHYRIVIADSRAKRDGRVIEAIGQYHPKSDPSVIVVDGERAKYWLGVGAQPTEAVTAILKVTGDWQAFKGEPAPAPMKVAAPPVDKKAVFEQAAKEAAGLVDKPATTPRAKKAPAAKADAPAAKAEAPAAEAAAAEAAAEAPVEGAPAVEEAPAAEAPAAEAAAEEVPAAEAATEDKAADA